MIVTERDRDAFRAQLDRRRRGGRPRVYEGQVEPVRVTLPGPLYDQIDRLARDRNTTVPDVIRRILSNRLDVTAAD